MKFDGIATANSIRWIIIFKLIDRLLLIGLRIWVMVDLINRCINTRINRRIM